MGHEVPLLVSFNQSRGKLIPGLYLSPHQCS